MNNEAAKTTWRQKLWIAGVLVVAVGLFVTAIDWGLPSRRVDPYLFGCQQVWPGRLISELQPIARRHSDVLGADVDRDPLVVRDRAVLLNPDDQDTRRAEILIRFRLYSYQPDEMITFQALQAMDLAERNFDPKLYQYGGFFIYAVAVLLKIAQGLGLLELRSDPTYYYDHPEAFGRFYIVARLYVVAFGLLGVWLCYVLGRRLANHTAGVLAAFIFAFLPLIINMAHEGKPHLPGAVLMLVAVWAACRYLQEGTLGWWLITSMLCGLALGMVLSAWLVFVLVPIMVILRPEPAPRQLAWIGLGLVVAAAVFLLGNPYLLVNSLTNPQVLRSNLANSTAMYQVGAFGPGMVNTVVLLAEALGVAVLVLAVLALPGLVRAGGPFALLAAPAVLVLVQMISIGAGKPGEYGRFAVYPAAALAICAGVGAERFLRRAWGAWWARVLFCVLVVILPINGLRYLAGFWRDASEHNSRLDAARWLAEHLPDSEARCVAHLAEPAPYATPPHNLFDHSWYLLPEPGEDSSLEDLPLPTWVVAAGDNWPSVQRNLRRLRLESELLARFPEQGRPTLISWANKPIFIVQCQRVSEPVMELASDSSP